MNVWRIVPTLGAVVALAAASAVLAATDRPSQERLEKATCSVSCDDGTSCSITSPPTHPKAQRLALERAEATAAVTRRKSDLLLLSPKMAGFFDQLDGAQRRGDGDGVHQALAAIFAEAAAARKPIRLTPKVSCTCSGISGSQAQCNY